VSLVVQLKQKDLSYECSAQTSKDKEYPALPAGRKPDTEKEN